MKFPQFREWLSLPPPGQRNRTLVMGILNVTPDSFSDGGQFVRVRSAVEQVRSMIEGGADLIDIGGESTRPGSLPVSNYEQINRVVPVIEAIRNVFDIALSIDTTQSQVARVALDAGANVINDISAGRDDEQMFKLAAEKQCPIILMHMQGTPATMQLNPQYTDVVREVKEFLLQRAQLAQTNGVQLADVLLDPGIGFGKTDDHNLQLLAQLESLTQAGGPLVVGTSRKGFIGRITGEKDASQRVFGTAATVAWCVEHGASIVRVHDVKEMAAVVRMTAALAAK